MTAQVERELTVEQRGIRSGEVAKERMERRKEPVVAIVRRTPEYDLFRKLPSLSGGRRPADVRFDPKTGKIYFTTWREKGTVTQDGRRFLKPPKRGKLPEYEVLLPRGRRQTPGYLENLPLKSPVQELLFYHADTLEKAIVKVSDILEAGIREQAQEVIGHTAKLANRFIERNLNEESLRDLAGQTGQFLENVGLANPASPSFQKIMERLKGACQRDSRGRINPLISRIRVQSAYIWAVRRLVVGGLVTKKHGENLNVLVYERETTRWAIANAVRQLEVFLGHTAFRHPERRVNLSQREIMVKVLGNITAGWLSLVRLAPYLGSAQTAALNLTGDLLPATQLLGEGNFPEAFSRIKSSCGILEEVLKQ